MICRKTEIVIGTPIDVLDWSAAISRICTFGADRVGRVVCICNAHSLVTARRDFKFREALLSADMVTADGAPVAWALRRKGFFAQKRINGPDLMLRYMAHAEKLGESVYFFGSSEQTLALLVSKFRVMFPSLIIAGFFSPPYRALLPGEDDSMIDAINNSGASTVWVGLGCPKQEMWMMTHRHRINSVMIGVGAAFDYHAGVIARAPIWMQNFGLEWFHRLCSEPGRLWKRYFFTNSAFIYFYFFDLFFRK